MNLELTLPFFTTQEASPTHSSCDAGLDTGGGVLFFGVALLTNLGETKPLAPYFVGGSGVG